MRHMARRQEQLISNEGNKLKLELVKRGEKSLQVLIAFANL